MQQRLLFTLLSLVWFEKAYGNPIPKIRVHPVRVQTSTVYQTTGSDISEKLKEIPNVYMHSSGYTGQSMWANFRGLTSPHALVMLDGIPLNDANAGHTDISHFARIGADQVKILSGPEVLLQTNQAGGVIQLNTSTSDAKTKATLEGGSFHSARANLKSTFVGSAATHTLLANHQQTAGIPKYDQTRINGERNRYHQDNMGAISHISLGDRTWMKTHARAMNSLLKYDDNLPALSSKPQATQDTTIYLIGADAHHASKAGKWQQKVSVSHAKQHFQYAPSSFTDSQETTLAYRHAFRWSWAHQTRFVVDTSKTALHKENHLKKQRTVSGVAALHSIQLTDTWSIEGGARQDYASKYTMPPRFTLGVAWQKNRTKLYGSWRQAMRLPTLYNLYATGPYVQPNPFLKQEEMELTEIGWHQTLNHNNTFQIVYFYNRLHNMMVGAPVNALASTSQNLPHHTVLQGMESTFQHAWQNQVALKGSYTYTHSAYPKNTTLKPIAPQHIIHLRGIFPTRTPWTFSPSIEYISQRFSMDHRLSPYILNHFEIIYDLKQGQQLYGQIKNIWDERYETSYGFRSPRRTFYVGTRIAF